MGGLPLEQMDQLALAVADGKAEPSAVVFRPGEKSLLTLSLEVHPRSATPSVEEAVTTALTAERIRYGNDEVLVVGIPDVHDDLGPDLARTILAERSREGSRLAGVILDLRGNGGGSTDGAIAALGLFLPGVPLFPMKRRDGTVDTDRAPEPPLAERWTGPVATFVDGDTASAAEMIAGGLMAYNRGPSLGTQTFGKGCAQEYLDDETGYGVLRLTTLLYAMPDGRPVQRVGLSPNVYFPFVSGSASNSTKREREALLPHAPPSWRGPDVRGPGWHHRRVSLDGLSVPWPNHGGNVGPCNDSNVCRALRALGTQSVGRRSTNGRLK
jgi:carboxyl-terminal processing protease